MGKCPYIGSCNMPVSRTEKSDPLLTAFKETGSKKNLKKH
jgi:hypothetical protein